MKQYNILGNEELCLDGEWVKADEALAEVDRLRGINDAMSAQIAAVKHDHSVEVNRLRAELTEAAAEGLAARSELASARAEVCRLKAENIRLREERDQWEFNEHTQWEARLAAQSRSDYANAEVERLRAEAIRVGAACQDNYEKLAAANVLLARVRKNQRYINETGAPNESTIWVDIEVHLSGQPAALTRAQGVK